MRNATLVRQKETCRFDYENTDSNIINKGKIGNIGRYIIHNS